LENCDEGKALGGETSVSRSGEGVTCAGASLTTLNEGEDVGVSILVKLKGATTVIGEVDSH